MPGFLLPVTAAMMCTHAAKATIAPTISPPRVLVSGQPAALANDLITVAGCPFQIPVGPGTKPQPCVTVKWLMVSARVTVMGQPLLLQPPPGPGAGPAICQSAEQIPQGPPNVTALQLRVTAQ